MKLKDDIKNRSIQRIDGKYLLKEFGRLMNLEKGYFFTAQELLLRPGKMISCYLYQDREKYFKPLTFVILNVAITLLLVNIFDINFKFFNIEIEVMEVEDPTSFRFFLSRYLKVKKLNEWSNLHPTYPILVFSFLLALWARIFFYRIKANIFEVLIAFCYVSGEMLLFGMVLFLGLLIYVAFWNLASIFIDLSDPVAKLSFAPYFLGIYMLFGLADFFDKKKFSTYLKLIVSFVLAVISYGILYLSTAIVITYFGA